MGIGGYPSYWGSLSHSLRRRLYIRTSATRLCRDGIFLAGFHHFATRKSDGGEVRDETNGAAELSLPFVLASSLLSVFQPSERKNTDYFGFFSEALHCGVRTNLSWPAQIGILARTKRREELPVRKGIGLAIRFAFVPYSEEELSYRPPWHETPHWPY